MGKYLAALKLLYSDEPKVSESLEPRTAVTAKGPPNVSNVSSTPGDIENFSDEDSVPFSDHEIAEHKIDQLKLRDDRIFVRRCLVGAYGAKRLEIVDGYLSEWQKGKDSETMDIKKENAGRKRANTCLLNRETKPH